MKHLTDNEIIESVLRGNKGDFSLLIDRYKDKGFNLLRRILKNEMDAEEALQDSFLKAFNNISSFRKEAQFSTWFYKIVFNTGLSILASKQQMISIDETFDIGGIDLNVYSSTENRTEYLLNIVDKLPIRNALVIILFYIDGLSLNEISKVLDISLVNTKVMLHRSRIVLKDLLIKHNYQKEYL